ncbi:hypothetical protein CR513_22375, partial [Mucuna pruriens]
MPNVPYGAAGYQQLSPQYTAPSFLLQQQRTPTQGNSPSLEDLMKQLVTSNLEFQQSVSSSNMQFQQNMTATIQDLKMQIRQLANSVSQLQSAGSSNLPSQTIPNLRGNASLRQGVTSTCIAPEAEVSRRLYSNCRLTIAPRGSCPIAISILDHLAKKTRF